MHVGAVRAPGAPRGSLQFLAGTSIKIDTSWLWLITTSKSDGLKFNSLDSEQQRAQHPLLLGVSPPREGA